MGLRGQQLEACLHKNWLQKRRNLRVTLCEVLSPLVLVLLLSYGYFQSDILSYDAKVYAQLDFDLPKDLSAFLPGGAVFGDDGDDDGGGFGDDATAAASGTDLASLNGIRKFLQKLLKGPLPAPTFDQFVLLSAAVSSGVDADLYNQLIGVRAQKGHGCIPPPRASLSNPLCAHAPPLFCFFCARTRSTGGASGTS
jgi:hypothetical protein